MIHFLITILRVVAIFGCAFSLFYYFFCLWSAAAFVRESKDSPLEQQKAKQGLPPVSILKPLKGTDPNICECFRSHCLQEYPEYEIIFGVSDADDPAVETVRQLQEEFPGAPIRLVVCPEILGTNRKVSNLAQMLPVSRHEFLIVNDSDIRVEPDYLRRIIEPLLGEQAGLVTCFYRGVPAETFGSRLEALGISSDFCPGVLAAKKLDGGLRFGMGSTLAFRRTDLERLGSFEAFADYLADDYELGKRIAGLGRNVHLSDVVVETQLPAYGFGDFLAHQLRWSRGMRDARPGGYFGLVFTFGLVWSAICVISLPTAVWAWGMAAGIVVLRFSLALFVDKVVLRNSVSSKDLWLLPLRDFVAAGVWLATFAGNTVTWRGDRFKLKEGKLIRLAN